MSVPRSHPLYPAAAARDPEWVRRQRARSEELIAASTSDFTAVYYAVYHLRTLLDAHPRAADKATVSVLEALLKRDDFAGQRQGLFLFRQAALTLVSIMVRNHGEAGGAEALGRQARESLHRVLADVWGHAHRAVAESLGSLPVAVSGPSPETDTHPGGHTDRTLPLDMDRLLARHGLKIGGPPRAMGRSRIFKLAGDPRILVLKATRPGEAPGSLINEVCWMHRLRRIRFPVRFDIPLPLNQEGVRLFRLKRLPGSPGQRCGYGILFLVHPDYFTYPAGAGSEPMAGAEFKDLMERNAWLLGRLTSLGVVHTAPIPLFHNRVQADRRRDGGRYEWFRAGRLDRWLASCDYPNLGMSGLRDFEHLVSISDREENLYRHIGAHFLSLFLVLGAFFRGRAAHRRGTDEAGTPVDARHLFDPALLSDLIETIFTAYYQGFVGTPFTDPIPLNLPELVLAMVEEMGVDRHMEEVLRIPDQEIMSDAEFQGFLKMRGISDDRIGNLTRGAADIVFQSGPHLGEFNRPISLPELIRAVETFSALCMADRYRQCRAAGDLHWRDWEPGA
jgi:hypothetical protein